MENEYSFDFSSGTYSASGTFTTETTTSTSSVSGQTGYLVTSISGFVTDNSLGLQNQPITSLSTPGSVVGPRGDSNDNLFSTSTPQFDQYGVTFTTANGTYDIFYVPGISFPGLPPQPGFMAMGGPPSTGGTPYYWSSGSFSAEAACFLSGTLIRTARGDVAVEELAIGDLVLGTSGKPRPVKWIGHRTIDCRDAPVPANVMPVRIAKEAFGPGKPERDFFVSPGHSICLNCMNEILIPAASLINGSTIKQVDVNEATYWHVELDEHDILVANGLPAESYMDCNNRAWFSGAQGRVDPDRPNGSTDLYCRPFFSSGPIVEACRARVEARAALLGWATTHDMGIHLAVDGRRINPLIEGDVARFLVRCHAEEVFLISETFVPAWWQGSDQRRLGLAVVGLKITDGLLCDKTISLDDPALEEVFYRTEIEEGLSWGWTNGRARIASRLWSECRGDFFLRIAFNANASRRWVEPSGGTSGRAESEKGERRVIPLRVA